MKLAVVPERFEKVLLGKHPLDSMLRMALFLAAVCMTPGCFDEKKAKPAPGPASVYVKKVVVKDAPIYYESFGYLSQVYNIDIKSQVTGKILSVHFKEGDFVKKGDLLYQIDPSEYQASLDKARAQLQESEAEYKLKTLIVDLDKKIADSGALAAQTYAKYQTEASVVLGQIAVDKAQMELCEINLGYCKILSPVDGVTSKELVDPGNVVMANSGPTLVNIKTVDPLYADFNIPDRYLAALRDCMSKSELTVELTPEQEHVQEETYSAKLDFLDNSVDNNTGTILLRATVPNAERKLWPGEYVRVKLIFTVQKDAVLAPADSVMNGKDGAYVFAIENGKAKYVPVTVSLRQGDYVMISAGAIKNGDDLVSAGQLGLLDGVPVRILNGSPDASTAESADKGSSVK